MKLVFSFVLLAACAHDPYVNTFRAGVITQQIVTESHHRLWSDPLNARIEVCDAAVPDGASVADLDRCMEPFTRENNDKILKTLASYNLAAAALSAALLAKEKDLPISAVVKAAEDLVALFPQGLPWLNRLKMLLKGLL